MKIKLVDVRHPRTGQPLAPLLWRNGKAIWPGIGAEGDDDTKDDKGDEDDEDSTDETDEDADDKADDDKKKKPAKKTVSVEEYNALQEQLAALTKRMKAADRNKSDAQKKLDALERKDKSELENTKTDLEKVTAERDKLKTTFASMARTNAFLIASGQEKINWHNPKVALKAADLDELEINEETGEVSGIRDAVKKLAKEQPFLVNRATDEDDDEETASKNGKRGPSGAPVGSGKVTGKGKKGALSDDELRRRFSALGR